MAMSVCGATGERDALSARTCWCGGLFCGRGGIRASQQFRRETRTRVQAFDAAQFDELMRQLDLFDGAGLVEKWNKRLVAHRVARTGRQAKCQIQTAR